MKVTNTLSGIALALLLASCGGEKVAEKATEIKEEVKEIVATSTFAVDASASSVNWRGFKLGGLYDHTGTVTVKKGSVELKGDKVVGGEVVIDMTTIDNTDLKDDAEKKAKLEGHLGAPDFFDVANHTTATFKITSVEGKNAKGNLTVRGITLPVTATLNETVVADGTVKVDAFLVFDRQNHKVKFQMPAGDLAISDDIEVKVSLVAKK